ncbi:hypothetical protein C8A03DRAFT_41566 [Achaetomium macrosporum]|uniref:Uncharacterized protein n=1 Tax=Achaetomium macrosporum TaxID=79813 RepID=A0AAN7CF59_9PEZI|nr:hypothetical protein C8A03DRAFT_41566 [Achaetomium macrosporum]
MQTTRARGVVLLMPWIASAILLALSILITVLAIFLEPSDVQCVRRNFVWSPATDQIEYHWETWADNDFFTKSRFFGLEPTQEIEDAWSEILPEHPISIPASKLGALNQSYPADDGDWIRDPEDPDAILGIPEYAAQLGCLNYLRQWSYSAQRDYSYLASFQSSDRVAQWERAHRCLERLRQAVMCWSDTGSLIKYWPDKNAAADRPGEVLHYDMGTYHYCRDFDKIQDWTRANSVKSVRMQNLWWSGDEDVLCKTYGIC